jgi:hypothetical protein
MQPEATRETSLTARSVEALDATRAWARLSGLTLVVLSALELVMGIMNLFHMPALPGSLQLGPGSQLGIRALGMIQAVIVLAIYGITGFYALRYARRLERIRPPARPGSGDIAVALGAQQRYWRVQGIATIIVIAVSILAGIAIALISINLVMHR